MADVVAELIAELKMLRKGRALYAQDIGARVGPAIRGAFDIGDDAPPEVIRAILATRLESLATALPEDLRFSIMVAFAIDQDARLPLFQARVGWLAERLHRDPRTAHRRIDDAIEHVAELAVAAFNVPAQHPGQAESTWHTAELRVSLALDRPGVEGIEFRRIVAERDGLDELDLALSVYPSGKHGGGPEDVSFDVFHGGTVVQQWRESSARVGYALRLPRRLHLGQAHEYTVRYQIGPGRDIRPHYVCVPKYRCELFDLHVRFDAGRQPRSIQRLAGLFQVDVTDPTVAADPIQIDPAGEAHATFRSLTPGMAYGLRWEY